MKKDWTRVLSGLAAAYGPMVQLRRAPRAPPSVRAARTCGGSHMDHGHGTAREWDHGQDARPAARPAARPPTQQPAVVHRGDPEAGRGKAQAKAQAAKVRRRRLPGESGAPRTDHGGSLFGQSLP